MEASPARGRPAPSGPDRGAGQSAPARPSASSRPSVPSVPSVPSGPSFPVLSAIEERLDHPGARGLAHAVVRAVRDGALAPGTRLPPIRRVAVELALSPTTVGAAWRLLAREGAIRTDGRRGTRVAEAGPPDPARYRRALDRPARPTLDLSGGVPDAALLPRLDRALAGLTTAGTPATYLDEPVLPELAAVLRADWPHPVEEVTVVDGAMDALDRVLETLVRHGDRVVVEHPCFPPLVDLLEARGAEVVPVPLDAEGPEPDALAAALREPTAAVVLQPRAQNPTGVSITGPRADRLADLIAATGAILVEDDSAGAIAASPSRGPGRRIPDRTVHIRSFSKSHGPDLRMAAVGGPAEVMGEVLGRRRLGQGWSSRLLQRVLLSLLTDPVSVAEVAGAREVYARRRAAVVGELAARGVVTGGTDGINLWMPVRDEAAAVERLRRGGIGVAPGSPFLLLPDAPGGDHVRVTVGLVPEGDAAPVAAALTEAARA
ncbi:aminotransferase class I/II-fold pyridoxal phosphate-dependent enzyme [Streptomyces calidiresistens]